MIKGQHWKKCFYCGKRVYSGTGRRYHRNLVHSWCLDFRKAKKALYEQRLEIRIINKDIN